MLSRVHPGVVWAITGLLAVAFLYVAATMVLRPARPGALGYVPRSADLPRFVEPPEWQEVDVRELYERLSISGRRTPRQEPYRSLSQFAYHRLSVPEGPQRVRAVVEREEPRTPEPQPPNQAEAERELARQVQIIMVTPRDAYVNLRQQNRFLTLMPVGELPARYRDAEMLMAFSGGEPSVAASLRAYGIEADVKEIVQERAAADGDSDVSAGPGEPGDAAPAMAIGVRFDFTYRDETYSIVLTRESAVDGDLAELTRRPRPPHSAPVQERPSSAGRSGPEGPRAEDADPELGTVDSSFPNSRQLGATDWVIGLDEAGHVHNNIDRILDDLGLQTVRNRESGQVEGLAVTNIPDGSHAAKRGLVAGDIVKSINGVPVASTADVVNYVRNNKDLPQYVVVLERAGQDRTLTYRNPRYRNDD